MPTIDELYWDSRYRQGKTGWDIGNISEPLRKYIDQIEDKNTKILIPGCGNAYEAKYLIEKGFTNIQLVDISASLIKNLQKEFNQEIANGLIQIKKADFFELEDSFDLILEQTFFCALEPKLRNNYAKQMHQLLKDGGKLCGLLFNHVFMEEGPPFGGSIEEYQKLFSPYFEVKKLEDCYNSIKPRSGKELFFILKKL